MSYETLDFHTKIGKIQIFQQRYVWKVDEFWESKEAGQSVKTNEN